MSAMTGPNPIPERYVIDWVPGLTDVANAIRATISGIADFFRNIIGVTISALSGLAGFFWSLVRVIDDLIKSSISAVIRMFKDITNRTIEIMIDVVDQIAKKVGEEAEKVLDNLKKFVAPWLDAGETRFLRASTNALVSYYSLRAVENAVKSWASGKIDFRTLIGRLIMAPILGVIGVELAQIMLAPAVGITKPVYTPPAYRVPIMPHPGVKIYDIPLVEEAGTELW